MILSLPGLVLRMPLWYGSFSFIERLIETQLIFCSTFRHRRWIRYGICHRRLLRKLTNFDTLVDNATKPCLARIPLRWMIRECFKTHSGVIFHVDGLKKIGLDHTTLYPIVLPRPPALPLDRSAPHTSQLQSMPKKGSTPKLNDDEETSALLPSPVEVQETEEEADLKDALAPIYDQLGLAWFWWLLELLPVKHRFQDSDDDKWKSKVTMNLGTGRHVPKQRRQGVRVHRTVQTRMEAEAASKAGGKYKPKANLRLECVTWVD